jgi:hypothetical protein
VEGKDLETIIDRQGVSYMTFRASTQSSVDLQSHAFEKEISVLQEGVGHSHAGGSYR